MINIIDSPRVESDLLQNANKVKTPINIFGLVNGMISSTILILPMLGVSSGYVTSIILCLIFGFVSYYTAYLLIIHIGDEKYPHQFILNHFGNDHKYLVIINFFVWIDYIPLFIIFIKIIVLNVEGLLKFTSLWIGPIVAISLVIVIITIRIFHLGENALAYGIIMVITYLFFLVWAQISAPTGPNSVVAFGQPLDMSAFLIMSFTIHSFLPMNMLKNPDRNKYTTAIKYSFTIATFVYIFVALGSFAIINRHTFKVHPQTVSQYFNTGRWQMLTMQIIFTLHILSTLPYFMIASKIRFFQIFKRKIKKNINWYEVFYILFMIAICYFIFATGINLTTLIVLDGSLVKYWSVIFTPVWLHLKCVYYDRTSGFIAGDQEWNSKIVPNKCLCGVTYRSKWTLYLETFFLLSIAIGGLGLFAFISISVFYKHKP